LFDIRKSEYKAEFVSTAILIASNRTSTQRRKLLEGIMEIVHRENELFLIVCALDASRRLAGRLNCR
jgi:hypothetical protein